jgi:hypothetical protein
VSEGESLGEYPAFPIRWGDGTTDIGLTKRELFAAMAMQGMMATSAHERTRGITEHGMAKGAVIIADALIAELAKQP